MISLDDQEAYCVSLIIANGGRMGYETLRDVVFKHRECFHGLSERYLKYTLVRKVLNNLANEGLLRKTLNDTYALVSDLALEEYLIRRHAKYVVKALKNLTAFRGSQKQHIGKFQCANFGQAQRVSLNTYRAVQRTQELEEPQPCAKMQGLLATPTPKTMDGNPPPHP